MKPFDLIVTDVEGDGLYYDATQLHCAVAICAKTEEVKRFPPEALPEYLSFIQGRLLIGHNLLDYDCPVMSRLYGIKFPVELICDTLVMSRMYYPERKQGHSLGSWGDALGEAKMDWRAEAEKIGLVLPGAPKGQEFKIYHPRMLDYNEQDCVVNLKLLRLMLKQLGWELKDIVKYCRGFNLG